MVCPAALRRFTSPREKLLIELELFLREDEFELVPLKFSMQILVRPTKPIGGRFMSAPGEMVERVVSQG